ncbi:hypothetical protein GE061_003807 [Apolygus lucorum]|uniref:Uncharacterized protein n=1 Tax=Apolygus lucorum TaxID=248454 RepID=A0A8S9X4T7_APOLU|nr:hypothetical protein GE061_003807 [Apolygus lucorum]
MGHSKTCGALQWIWLFFLVASLSHRGLCQVCNCKGYAFEEVAGIPVKVFQKGGVNSRIQPIGHSNQNNLQDAGKTASKATQTEHSPTSKLDTSINSDITGTKMLDTGLQAAELDDTVTSDFAGFWMSEIGPLYQTTSKSNGAVSTQGTSGSPGGMTTRSGLVVRPLKEHP